MDKYINAVDQTRVEKLPWDEQTIQSVESLRTESDELVLLRRALTGQKVSRIFYGLLIIGKPIIAMCLKNFNADLFLQTGLPLLTTMKLLGRDETLHRLSDALLWADMELVLRK